MIVSQSLNVYDVYSGTNKFSFLFIALYNDAYQLHKFYSVGWQHDLEGIWKEVVLAHFAVVLLYLPEGSEENSYNPSQDS